MKAYPHYPANPPLELDGFWEFSWLGDVDWDSVGPAGFVGETSMAVPGVFDSLPDYSQKRGVGIYRKCLGADFAPGERLRLQFGGLGLYAKVWFDGEAIGECSLPYSGVDYDCEIRDAGSHELVVAIDNRFDPERVPLFNPNYDFYAYGGIYRRVSLRRLPRFAIDRVQVVPLDLTTGCVRLTLQFADESLEECTFSVSFDDGEAQQFSETLENGCVSLQLAVPNAKIWSPEEPNLHFVKVETEDDSIRERFGLRTIATSGREILLNGKPIELRGFNRHEAHPQLGPIETPELMLADLQWLKRMNGNFLRLVHYPHDQAFLDLCDEMGILVWSESLGWGNQAAQLADPRFGDLQEEQTRLMVRDRINHPSVIIWAFINEGQSSHENALPLYRRLADCIREEDSSRLVSYASNHRTRDLCFEVVDVISLNTYPGWINTADWNTPTVDMIAPHIEEELEFFSSKSPHADKPLIYSEIGACGFYGSHDFARSQWTEEFQSDYMLEASRCILEHPRTCGIALWQFCDSRSYGASGAVRSKPLGMNLAGVLDEYRHPKLACTTLADYFATRINQD